MFWSKKEADVLVIGAGLAGLRAATKLHKAGVDVTVLEARDRVGGRTYTVKTQDGHTFDMGANWVGPTQDHIVWLELIKEFGLKTQLQYHEGKHILDLGGNLSQYEGNISDLTLFGRPPELDAVVSKLDQMAVGVDVETLSSIQDVAKKDHTSYATWIDQNVKNEGAKNLLKWFSNVCLASEPSEFSLLYFLMFLNQGGSYARLANIADGAQQETIIGGSQQVSERMAKQLPSGSVHLKSAVTKIRQDNKCVVATTEDGRVFKAKYAIIALPMNIVGRITYDPPMPAMRDQLTQRMPMGCVIKVILCYKKAWWKERGLSGEVISDVSLMYDKSSHDDHQPALVGFIGGANARAWSSKTVHARKQAVLAQMRRFYPDVPEATQPTDYFEHDWAQEQYSRGCYVNIMTPGVMTECGETLRKPVGRLHWAGSETARKWMAYMDGAVESGVRASSEIIERMKQSRQAKI